MESPSEIDVWHEGTLRVTKDDNGGWSIVLYSHDNFVVSGIQLSNSEMMKLREMLNLLP